MSKYRLKPTSLIAEAFEKHDIRFSVKEALGTEIIIAGFSVDGGPLVSEWFVCSEDGNSVAARVFSLISKTPEEKRSRVMNACNILNRRVRYLKFDINEGGDVNAEYDFPVSTPDDSIGEMAVEIFIRTMQILDIEFSVFMKAIYTDDDLEEESLRQKLERFRSMLEVSRWTCKDSVTDADESECSEDEPDTAASSDDDIC